MTAPALFRLRHQLHAEWLHQRGSVLVWCLWLVLGYWRRVTPLSEALAGARIPLNEATTAITVLLAMGMVFRCVRADSPSNPESAVLTRPMGRPSLWLAKALFVLLAFVLPWLVMESLQWRGFAHPLGQWVALSAGGLLTAGILCALVAAVAVLATGWTQLLLLTGLVGAGMAFFSETDAWLPLPHLGARDCGDIVASVLLLLALMLATWLCYVPRRRGWALLALVLGLIQQPFTEAAWPLNWLRNPPASYPKRQLTLSVGTRPHGDPNTAQMLWPTLHLRGLAKDEVATVLEFAPITPGKPWPGLGSYSDLSRNPDDLHWLRLDHFRVLKELDEHPWLWGEHIAGRTSRDELPRIAAPWKLAPKTPPPAARLRLAIHRMRPVATLPFRELWQGTHRFIVHPGLRVELPPFHFQYNSWRMEGSVQRQMSRLVPDVPHARIQARSRPLVPSFILVLHDPALREVDAYDCYFNKGHVIRPKAHLWQYDEAREMPIMVKEPEAQRYLLKTTHEEWVNRLNATLWYAEERGTVELELTAAQMAVVLAEAKPEVKKP